MKGELESRYNFLRTYVPKTAPFLLDRISEQIDIDRRRIISNNRIISLLPLLNGHDFQSFKSWYHFIFDPKLVTPPIISPSLIQKVSYLITFIHQNLPSLLQGVIEKYNHSFLIYSALPSLFGFFSSSEHFSTAFQFYISLVGSTPAKIGMKILKPFFHATFLYPFFESVFTPYIDMFLEDERLQRPEISKNEYSELLRYYVNDLKKYILSSCILLPHEYSCILSLSRDRWGQKYSAQFFFIEILDLECKHFLESNGEFSRMNEIDTIFLQLISDVQFVDSFYSKLKNIFGNFEIPSFYQNFENPFMNFFISIKDAITLAKTIHPIKTLPNSLQSFLENDIPIYYVLSIKIFPKNKVSLKNKTRPLIFHINDDFSPIPLTSHSKSSSSLKSETFNDSFNSSDINKSSNNLELHEEYERIWLKLQNAASIDNDEPYNFMKSQKMKEISKNFPHGFEAYALSKQISLLESTAKDFEKLMEFLLGSKTLTKWISISLSMIHVQLSYLVSYLGTSNNLSRLSVSEAYTQFGPLLPDYYSKVGLYLTLVEDRFRKNIPKSIYGKIFQMNEKWLAYVRTFNAENTGMQQQTMISSFFECVNCIRSIDHSSLHIAFRKIISVMKKIEKISKSEGINIDELFSNLIALSGSRKILIKQFILREFGMDKQTFNDIIKPCEKDMLRWVTFEGLLLKIIVKSPHPEEFFSIQELLKTFSHLF